MTTTTRATTSPAPPAPTRATPAANPAAAPAHPYATNPKENPLTDHTLDAFVHEVETTRRELWDGGPGGYETFLTVQIATADLTRIDLTRPIEIHQGDPND